MQVPNGRRVVTQGSTFTSMDFHDATLLSVEFDWATGSAVVLLSNAVSTFALVAKEVLEVRVSRQQPWGPSVSVNSLSVAPGELTIEMQSGDAIVIAAQSFVLPE